MTEAEQEDLFEDDDELDEPEGIWGTENPPILDTEAYVDAELMDVVKLDDLALDEEFMRYAGDLAHWNAKYSSALKRYMLEKFNFEKTRARLWLEIKNEEHAEGSKPTVEDIKAMVFMRREYEGAQIRLIEAEVKKERLKREVDSVIAKKDMLQSLGAKLRVELEGDPATRSQHRDSRYGG